MKLTASLTLLTQALAVLGADTTSWKSRTIYFALTDRVARSENDNGGDACGNLQDYCGGTFKGLQSKLDYIKGMGFDAIWITPVVERDSAHGYHGYWAKDLYSINSHYGTSDDLKNLVNAAHDKGIYMMVDVVANHMGNGPISENKPSPLNQASSYHAACDINYNDQHSIEVCRVGNLPDLDTTDPAIRSVYKDWIKWLMQTYQFDGSRIDTVKHVEKDYWPDFAWASGSYTIGEVYNGDPDYFAGYAKLMGGLVNYPVYYPLNRFYQQQNSSQALVDMHNRVGALVPDAAALGTFVDNHDQPRFLAQKNDVSLFKNALTYVMLARGIPIVYYGSEQAYDGAGDPDNREDLWRSGFRTDADVYTFLRALGRVRSDHGGLARADDHVHLFVESDAYAWSRQDGAVIALTSNIGQGQQRQFCFYTQQNNKTWRGVFDGKTYTSGGDGKMCATVHHGEPMVFVAQ